MAHCAVIFAIAWLSCILFVKFNFKAVTTVTMVIFLFGVIACSAYGTAANSKLVESH